MPDKTGEPRSNRGGSSLILGGLAASAILGVSVVAAEAPAAAEPTAVVSATGVRPMCGMEEQFQNSFTPGAVSEQTSSLISIICNENR